jgi:hypothetical protein
MKSEDFSILEIMWIIFVIILAIFILYYYNYLSNIENPTNTSFHIPYIGVLFKNNIKPIKKEEDEKIRCPQKLTNLYNEEPTILSNKYEIDLVNKNAFNMYNDSNHIDNRGFDEEIIRHNSIDSRKLREFDKSLNDVYTMDLVENDNPNYDYNEIYDYTVKPNKSDLPLVNVPLYALNDGVNSLKLSDRIYL